MAAIFDLPLTPLSDIGVHTYSPTELMDPENVDVAFGISLISCIDAEILRCFISSSGFRWPSLICDLRRHIALCSRCVPRPQNAGLVLGFQLVLCIEAET